MRKSLTIALSLFATAALSQTAVLDSVLTNGSTEDVFYSLENGVVSTAPAENWDLAFTTRLIDASVLVNDVKGVHAYVVSENIADWNKIDTSGKLINRLFNNDSSWAIGALANMNVRHPDYGWGTYNQATRNLNGSRIFVLKLKDETYRKFMIEAMATNGNWTFKIAELDGSNERSKTVNKNDYAGKNFLYYDINADQFIDREPASESWDLLFSKYMSPINTGPGGVVHYPVTGALLNANAQNAERVGVEVENDDTSQLNWNSNFSTIGGDWKSFNRTTFQYEFADSLVYFVRTVNGDVYKLYFTDYVGGPMGKFEFYKKKMTGIASVNADHAVNLFGFYPSPANSHINIESSENGMLTIYNSQAQLVFRKAVKRGERQQIAVESWARGLYFIELQTHLATSTQRLLITP